MMDAVAALEPKLTLDVACGTGFVTGRLRGEVLGIDQSEKMLDLARRRCPRATFVRADALQLPFEDGAFERAFASHFYGHLEEPDRLRFLTEARRVAPELVIVDAALQGGKERSEWQDRVLKDGSSWTVFKRFFTPDALISELGGGEVVHAGYWFVAVASQSAASAASQAA